MKFYLVFYLKIFVFSNYASILIPERIVNIAQANNVDYVMAFNKASESCEIIMKNKNKFGLDITSKDALFKRETELNAYSLYLSNKKLCYNQEDNKIVVCLGDQDEGGDWVVRDVDDGIAICTYNENKFEKNKSDYQYCLTVSDEKNIDGDIIVNVEISRFGHENQLFEIYDTSLNARIDKSLKIKI